MPTKPYTLKLRQVTDLAGGHSEVPAGAGLLTRPTSLTDTICTVLIRPCKNVPSLEDFVLWFMYPIFLLMGGFISLLITKITTLANVISRAVIMF